MKKTHKIIMLPTEDATFLVDGATDGIFYITEGPDKSKLKGDTNVHLYILSDDEIKEGDWKYHEKIGYVWKHQREGKGLPEELKSVVSTGTKKVIATTDPNLTKVDEVSGDNVWTSPIPQVPQSLVEYYAKHKPEQVELEYEVYRELTRITMTPYNAVTKLKLVNNEVVWVEHSLKDGLKKVIDRIDGMIGDKTKRYTREEVEKLFLQFREEHLYIFDMTNEEYIKQWLKENL